MRAKDLRRLLDGLYGTGDRLVTILHWEPLVRAPRRILHDSLGGKGPAAIGEAGQRLPLGLRMHLGIDAHGHVEGAVA
jgi:hypothetical protein